MLIVDSDVNSCATSFELLVAYVYGNFISYKPSNFKTSWFT